MHFLKTNGIFLSSGLSILYGLIHLYSGVLLELFSTNKLLLDNFDSNLIVWIFERNYIAIKSFDFINFWNASSFYPHSNTLAYSDSMISGQLFYFPLRIIGLEPLTCIYFTLISIMVIAVISLDFLLTKYYEYSTIERLLFIIISLFALSMVNFFGHYQLIAFQLSPSFFVLLMSYLNKPSNKKLILLTILFIFISSFASYFAPMAFAISFLVMIFFYKFNLDKYKQLFKSLNEKDKKWICLSILVILIFFIIQIKPYLSIPKLNSFEDYMNVATQYSARPWSLIQASPKSLVYPMFEFKFVGIHGYWERAYFPGILGILSIILFYIFKFKEISYERYHNEAKLYSIFLISLYVLSLGPMIKIPSLLLELLKNSDELKNFKIHLPFYYLAKFLPGLENVRAPGRFGMMMTVSFAFMTIYVTRILTKKINKKNIIYSLLIIFFIYENQIKVTEYEYEMKNKEFIKHISVIIKKHEPTLTLPYTKASHLKTIKNYMDILNASNIHRGRTVAGYGARTTKESNEIAHIDNEYKSSKADIITIVNWSIENNIKYLIVLDDQYISDLMSLTNKKYKLKYKEKSRALFEINLK